MPEKRPEPLEEDYKVATSDIFITVEYGFAQIGGGVVKLDGVKIDETPVDNRRLGTGAELKGRTLIIKSIVADSNDATNKVSVVYRLIGGKENKEFISEGEVANDGDPMPFRGTFHFI